MRGQSSAVSPWVTAAVIVFAGFVFGPASAEAKKIGSATSSTVVIDTGDRMGGFSVEVSTPAKVLLSNSGLASGCIWRLRTFQVTGTAYSVWMSTYSAGTYGSGAGWYVAGSSGTYTTRNQAALYGILDPAAAAGTGTVVGPWERQGGEVPSR